MEKTGERYLPEFDADWTLEHTHRYLLVRELVHGKEVLDIACGDGYGSSMLAEVARKVTGVDICAEVVERAKNKYARDNVTFLHGSALDIPLPDASVDVVVSFETLEHLAEHEEMLAQIRRVLRPEGLLIISTPDKHEYGKVLSSVNEYHVKELYPSEFLDLLQSRFASVRMWGQRLVFGSVIGAGKGPQEDVSFLSWRKGDAASRSEGLFDPIYLIALASDAPLPTLPSSVLAGQVESSDYATMQHEQNIELQKEIIFLKEHWQACEVRCQELDAKCFQIEGERQYILQSLQDILQSKSWKITAPLRAVMKILKQTKNT